MTYIIAEPCIDIKDRSCVDVCPVDCIHEFDRILIIDPRSASTPRPAPPGERGARRPLADGTIRTEDQDERSGVSELHEQIRGIIEGEDVALFMKGTPQFAMCGNSQRALDALRRAGAPVTAV